MKSHPYGREYKCTIHCEFLNKFGNYNMLRGDKLYINSNYFKANLNNRFFLFYLILKAVLF